MTAPIVTTHAADRYRERVVPELDFNEAHLRLRTIAATAEVSANAPLWLDHLAGQRGLRFLVGPGLRAGCGLIREGAIVTVLTPEFAYDEGVGFKKLRQQSAEQFDRRMFASYRDAEEQGYEATSTLLRMVRNLGAVQAAKHLLASPGWEEPLERLRDVGALDLSIEAHVLDPRYSHLFSPEERAAARDRLAQLDFSDP